jgi:hypothetical protein
MTKQDTSFPSGPGVDAADRPVLDPTANVIAILAAAVQRQDDLRDAHERYSAKLAETRSHYEDRLREAEAKRIDAIRAVDVNAVSRAAEVSAQQAMTLANQVAVSAETLRNQVAAAASAQATALAAALEPINAAIADLRRVQYESVGQRTQVVEGRDSNKALYALGGFVISLMLAAITVVGFLAAAK